jgi:hypothetical protein
VAPHLLVLTQPAPVANKSLENEDHELGTSFFVHKRVDFVSDRMSY